MVVHWVWSFLHDYYVCEHKQLWSWGVLKGWLPRASLEPMWIQDVERMRLVWVWAAVRPKCQQDPRNGTQCRVAPRCGRCGSIYHVLMSYFLCGKCVFLLVLSGLIRDGKGHVGRKWDIDVLEKTEQYSGGIKTWNRVFGNVLWRDQQVELRITCSVKLLLCRRTIL
jgi:hypothetical protein